MRAININLKGRSQRIRKAFVKRMEGVGQDFKRLQWRRRNLGAKTQLKGCEDGLGYLKESVWLKPGMR